MNQHQSNFREKILQLSLFEQKIKYKKLPQVWENKISIRFTFMTQKKQLKIHPFQIILEIAFHLKTNHISIASEVTCQDISWLVSNNMINTRDELNFIILYLKRPNNEYIMPFQEETKLMFSRIFDSTWEANKKINRR